MSGISLGFFAGGASVFVDDNSVTRNTVSGAARARLVFGNTGTLQRTFGNTATLFTLTGQWLNGSTTGSNYEIQGTWSAVSGGTTSGPTGWVSLGTTREWYLEASAANTETATLTIEIRPAGGGANLDTGVQSFSANSGG